MAARMEGRFVPSAGLFLAAVTGVALLIAGVDFWLVFAMLAVWVASFWVAVPPPPAVVEKSTEGMTISPRGMRDLIEHSGLAILLLDENRIIVANAHAREEIGKHIVGQDARVALRHPVAIDLLSRPEGGSVPIQGLTGPRSNWQMTLQRIDERYCLIELINRTSEADVSRAHTDFVANASHELRTPLASIIGYMETLAEEGADVPPVKAKEFYSTVLREARRLQALVEDLMSLSRAEAEKHDYPAKTLDLVQLVSQAARDAAGFEQGSRIKLDIPAEKLSVRGDRNQLEQLVRNLVDNAMKYGRPESPITVSLRRGDRAMAVLEIKDRGEGIDAEHIPHLTRRFYRTDPGRSRAVGGTGLGLAIVKHIVERHRGRLDISSEKGTGTTVAVRLPAVAG
ncbi:sensor histidine kinase [Erythrobacter alti]|uniref:sensor histidine kinase n=1 Tax=Erythrobacter alti TaxID=1896145 RepID=UPI0030F37755